MSTDSAEKFVTIIRKPEGLFRLSTRRRCAFHEQLTFREMADFYEFNESKLPNLAWETAFKSIDDFILRSHPGLYWGFCLWKDRGLLTAFARLVSYGDSKRIGAWSEVLKKQLPNRRSVFIAILLESEVIDTELSQIDFELFDHLKKIVQKEKYKMRVLFLMSAIKKRIRLEQIRMMLELTSPETVLRTPCSAQNFPIIEVRSLLRYLHGAKGSWNTLGIDLWFLTSKLRGFSEILKRTPFRENKQRTVLEYLRMFLEFGLWTRRSAEEVQKSWPSLFRQAAHSACPGIQLDSARETLSRNELVYHNLWDLCDAAAPKTKSFHHQMLPPFS